MNKMIQVRNLAPDLHKKVKIRAAEEGQSITDWVENLIIREVERPSMKDIFAMLKSRQPMHLNPAATEMVREDQDRR
jgi:antitoxin FitA